MSNLPVYRRTMLTDPAIPATTSERFANQVDCNDLRSKANRGLLEAIVRSLRARQTRARKRGEAWPYHITLGQIAKSGSIAPEEAAEAILAHGYWIYFERDPAMPVADWVVDEEGD